MTGRQPLSESAAWPPTTLFGLLWMRIPLVLVCLLALAIHLPAAGQGCPQVGRVSEERPGWKGALTTQCLDELLRDTPQAAPLRISGFVIDEDNIKARLLARPGTLEMRAVQIEGGLSLSAGGHDAIAQESLERLVERAKGPLPQNLAMTPLRTLIIADSEILASRRGGFALQGNDLFIDVLQIERTRLVGPVLLDGLVVNVQVALVRSSFEDGSFSMQGAHILPSARQPVFEKLRFAEAANFDKVRAHGCIAFHNVEFEKGATFSDLHLAECDKLPLFRSARFRETTRFSGMVIAGSRGLGDPVFDKQADFVGLRVAGSLFLHEAKFVGPVSFRSAKIDGDIRMDRAAFNSLLDLRELQARRLDWHNGAGFIHVPGIVDARGAHLCELFATNLIFDERVDFGGLTAPTSKTSECPRVQLRSVIFRDAFGLSRVKGLAYAEFEDVDFAKEVDFRGTSFHSVRPGQSALHIGNVRFDKLSLRWAQLPPVSTWTTDLAALPARPAPPGAKAPTPNPGRDQIENTSLDGALETLEAAFLARSRLEDANQARYHLEDLRALTLTESGSWWDVVAGWSVRVLWGWTTGYGRDAPRAIASTVGLVVVYTLLLWSVGSVRHVPAAPKSDDDKVKLHLLELPATFVEGQPDEPTARRLYGLGVALELSVLLLLKVGRLTARASSVHRRMLRTLVAGGWVLGYFVLACLMVTLANTQPILNALVRSVF